MPQATSLVVNDRASTPVAQTFAPGPRDSGNALFVRSSSTLLGKASFSLRTRQSGSRLYKRILLAVPVVQTETINGVSVPKVVRTGLVDCTFRFDDSSELQERKDLVGMFANALAASQTMVDAYLVNGEEIW